MSRRTRNTKNARKAETACTKVRSCYRFSWHCCFSPNESPHRYGPPLLRTRLRPFMFAYCGNNPINRYDPSGNSFLGIAAGAVILKYLAAFAASALLLIGIDSIVNNPPASPPITIPKFEFKSESTEKTKDQEKSASPVLPKKPKDPIHHIVAKADPRAAEARQILRDVGIEPVTDMRNLVALPAKYHASLHTTAYHSYVTERLRPVAGNRVGVELVLASLKAEIVARSAIGIRWD